MAGHLRTDHLVASSELVTATVVTLTSVARFGALLAATVLGCSPMHSNTAPPSIERPRVLEIRSYNLKPGSREAFQRRFERESLPLLKRWKVDVVDYGPSLHDEDSWFLMRSYSSLEERRRSEDDFYGSNEWRVGPREATLADIASYTTVVLLIDEATLRQIRDDAERAMRVAR